MPIPNTTRERIFEAMTQFDSQLSDTNEWNGWEDRASHKFALVKNGQLYPMKKVISLATGVAKNTFNGGAESIAFFQRFDVQPIEALRLPVESEVKAALHDLLLARHPEIVIRHASVRR